MPRCGRSGPLVRRQVRPRGVPAVGVRALQAPDVTDVPVRAAARGDTFVDIRAGGDGSWHVRCTPTTSLPPRAGGGAVVFFSIFACSPLLERVERLVLSMSASGGADIDVRGGSMNSDVLRYGPSP